ncbi:MAG: P1 family peptidase [Bacillota bacterium]
MGAITDVRGLLVGHATDVAALTGCTVILCPAGATAGVDVRGGAPGTRETDLLRAGRLVQEVHGVLLTGGSAFGLDAAGGVMRYLEERGAGFDTGLLKVPIVPAAVLYDLGAGASGIRPGPDMGYAACLAAGTEVAEGSVGAGTGATVGKLFGACSWMKGGVGTASRQSGDLVCGAIAAVNAFGDVLGEGGRILAGARQGGGLPGTANLMAQIGDTGKESWPLNTTLAVVATNASLDKGAASALAVMASAGLGRTLSPAFSMFDGDIVFALATGEVEGDLNLAGALCAWALAEAVGRAVTEAVSLGGIPAARDFMA